MVIYSIGKFHGNRFLLLVDVPLIEEWGITWQQGQDKERTTMSLTVPRHVLEMAERGEVPLVDFWHVVQNSLPYFVRRVEELVAELMIGEMVAIVNHAPSSIEEFGQLLRGFASDPIRRAAEEWFGITLRFVNCHKTLAAWADDQSKETIAKLKEQTSVESQLLNQDPKLVNC